MLYPNFLRGIDHYLKINYPYVWRTRVHDFLWFSLVLGNVVAVGLVFLMLQRRNILSVEGINTVYWGATMFLCFVVVLWAMRLLQFKIKFSNFKTILVTWLLYVLCVASLAVNLTIFTYSMVYRTASFAYATQDYHEFFRTEGYGDNTYTWAKLLKHYGYNENSKYDHMELSGKMHAVSQANIYFELPRPSVLMNEGMPFHKLFWKHKIGSIMATFFLPILLFSLSLFNLRTVLVSLFGTLGVYAVAGLLGVSSLDMMSMLISVAVVLVLMLVGVREHVKNWNYVLSLFIPILGAILFISLENSYVKLTGSMQGYWWDSFESLIPFVFAPPLIAWIVAKKNALPVKNEQFI